MARKRNQNVNRITVDIMDLAARFLGMNDDEIGAWMRKAVSDWNNGCTADDVDPLVKECYERSLEAMQKRQDINAQNYLAHHRKIKALCSGKPDMISTNDKTAETTTPSAGGSCATNYSLQEASTRKDEDEHHNTENGALRNLAPSCRQSFTADAPTREDGEFKSDSGDAGNLESATSANIYGDAAISDDAEACTCRESGRSTPTTVSKNMRRVPQNEAPAHGFSGGRTAQGTMSRSQEAAAQSWKDSTLDSRTDKGKQPNEAWQSRPAAERGKGSRVVSLPSDAAAGSLALVTNNSVKKPYGTCGHVMLSDEEGRHLREVYGENLRIAIDILDAYIENNGKAAKKYKNHAAVLRKGNWVYEKIQTMALNEKRIKNAAHQCDHRSFAQKDRDDRSNWLTTSIFENEAANG